MMMKFRVCLVLLLALLVQKVSGGTNDEGVAFLDKNKAEEGVITLPSGLQYKVLRKGDGVHHPAASSPCSCHYEGTLIDGTVFDSSYERGSPTSYVYSCNGWLDYWEIDTTHLFGLVHIWQICSQPGNQGLDRSHAVNGRRRQMANVYSIR
jgi:Domain amino terminal to FKBP-type peptidyl-prolyl isomerase